MREILFRGKIVGTNNWITGGLSLYSEPGEAEIMYPLVMEDDDFNSYETFDWVKVELSTVGQFTGLLDKNGKRIFEGDIVMYPYVGSYLKCRVEYINGGFCPFAISGSSIFWNPKDVTVIGNIHDNPELLEEDSHVTA